MVCVVTGREGGGGIIEAESEVADDSFSASFK